MKRINAILLVLAVILLAGSVALSQPQRILGGTQLDLDNNAGAHVFLTNASSSLGINATGLLPNTCALLDLSSITKGFLVPRMTTLQELALCSGAPPEGLIVYNTNTHTLDVYNGSAWGASGWALTGNTGTNSAVNFLGTTDAQDLVIKTNNVERVRVLSSGGLISRVNGIGAYTGPSSGVVGLTNATFGAGIVGLNGLTTASGSLDGGLTVGQGIYGETIKDAAAGVEGVNSGASNWGFGVIGGVTSGANVQAGVLGISATNTGAENYGVVGEYTTGGIGNPTPPTTIANAAVMGVSTVTAGVGVGADNTAAGGIGLLAQANGANGTGISVNASTTGINITSAPTSINATGIIQTTGDITLTPATLHAVGGVESLRIIRGTVSSAGAIQSGTGFTITHVAGSGRYNINYTTPFTGSASVTFGPFAGAPVFIDANGLSANACFVDTWNSAGVLTDEGFCFIAIGPR